MLMIITPAIGWSWPALAPIVTAVAAYYGYKAVTAMGEGALFEGKLTQKLREMKLVEVALPIDVQEEIASELRTEEALRFVREDCILIFRRDVRGKFRVEVMTENVERTRKELEDIGREFAMAVVQEFAHSRLVRELDRKGITVIGEERAENGDIVLRTRRWGG